jgi:hypothetical protein
MILKGKDDSSICISQLFFITDDLAEKTLPKRQYSLLVAEEKENT